MESRFLKQRLDTLKENITQILEQQKNWEKEFFLADGNPTQKDRCRERIRDLKSQFYEYNEEYEQLKQQAIADPSIRQSASEQLNRIEIGVQDLKYGQAVILGEIDQAVQVLLDRYDESQRSTVAEITSHLDKNQFQLLQVLLNILDSNTIPDAEIQSMTALIEKRLATLPPDQANVAGITRAKKIAKDPSLDTKHRLKLFLPIIPIILSYEGEIELGAGANLPGVWDWVKKKLLP
ncbi:hypothetical protein [Nostoc sp. DedQUE07]|uniref:hypothetical protein n=1 Tax=Nostoc sp. DedQUE07 TaxID=3075392 RepID=UPI002AD47117|nr:hypothetical protein [Nostoc sp. DedQUE07]MDZ8130705.1 hypothetical protein [Nostoc sp. DedQUE07]